VAGAEVMTGTGYAGPPPSRGMRYNDCMMRRRVVVRGRVQGVFFRDACRQRAASHRVAGWIRNRPDGAVEAVFEGEPEAVEAMTRWCRSGPPRAEVEQVEVADESPTGDQGFEVR
jgi:acylphosphatase